MTVLSAEDLARIQATPPSHVDPIKQSPVSLVSRLWVTLPSSASSSSTSAPSGATSTSNGNPSQPVWIIRKSSTANPKFAREPHDIVKELRLLRMARHPNVVDVLGWVMGSSSSSPSSPSPHRTTAPGGEEQQADRGEGDYEDGYSSHDSWDSWDSFAGGGGFEDEHMLHIYMPYIPISLSDLLSSPYFSPHPFPPQEPLSHPSDDSRASPVLSSTSSSNYNHNNHNHNHHTPNTTPPSPSETQFTSLARSITVQTLLALAYLHSPHTRIAHRDVKPDNVLLTREGVVKIVDFGVSYRDEEHGEEEGEMRDLWREEKGRMYFEVCTGPYRPPELLFGTRAYDPFAVDMWSFGTVLAEFFRPLRLVSDEDDEDEDGEDDEEEDEEEEDEEEDGDGEGEDYDEDGEGGEEEGEGEEGASGDRDGVPHDTPEAAHTPIDGLPQRPKSPSIQNPKNSQDLKAKRKRSPEPHPKPKPPRGPPPFTVPRFLRLGYPGTRWVRTPLFDGARGEIGLAWSVFKVLGTPTRDSWPEFEDLPGAKSVVFNVVPPVPLEPLLPNLPPSTVEVSTPVNATTTTIDGAMECGELEAESRSAAQVPETGVRAGVEMEAKDTVTLSSVGMKPEGLNELKKTHASSASTATLKALRSDATLTTPTTPSASPSAATSSSSTSEAALPAGGKSSSSAPPIPTTSNSSPLEGAAPTPLDLLMRFLVYPPGKRLKAREALSHPWLSAGGLLVPRGYDVSELSQYPIPASSWSLPTSSASSSHFTSSSSSSHSRNPSNPNTHTTTTTNGVVVSPDLTPFWEGDLEAEREERRRGRKTLRDVVVWRLGGREMGEILEEVVRFGSGGIQGGSGSGSG